MGGRFAFGETFYFFGAVLMDIDKCCLTCYPAGVLGERAKPINEIGDKIRNLADRMVEIMVESKGIGLAGPQAGVGLRIFVVSVDGSAENAKVYINPEIITSGAIEAIEEGCLSLPGIYAKVRRYKECSVKATDLEGNEFTEDGEGLLARAFQHEYDHLEGMLIKDRFSRVQMIGARKQLKELKDRQ